MGSSAEHFIGLMSGTSADAVDAVLLTFEAGRPVISGHLSHPLPPDLQDKIASLCIPGRDNLDLLGETDLELGHLFAHTALSLIEKFKASPDDISAIGSHGQTVRHRPPNPATPRGFSIQIADPNIIAAETGITTVADFRRKDMALGGQGAPLAPGFHQQVFSHPEENRVILNLGGIGNITWLGNDNQVLGFDTGPANTLLDHWCLLHQDLPYDDKGTWAASGTVNKQLLERLLSHPYLEKPLPKSTGREEFSPNWLSSVLVEFSGLPHRDVQATLATFSVECIVAGLALLPGKPARIYACGGGVYNNFLMASLHRRLPPDTLETTASLGIDPMQVEGATFAWLARQTLHRLNGSIASVTGAGQSALLGGIYYP